LACHIHVLAECAESLAVVPVQSIKQTPAAGIGQRFEHFIDIDMIRSQWRFTTKE